MKMGDSREFGEWGHLLLPGTSLEILHYLTFLTT